MRIWTHSLVGAIVFPLAVLAVDSPYDRFRDMRVPVRTPLIKELLPNHDVIALPFLRAGEKSVIVTDKTTGTSIRLGENWRAASDEEKYFRVPDVSRLLAALDVSVPDGKSAIKVAQLVEDLTGSPMEIKVAMINKKDFTLFDDRVYTSREAKRKHWLYTVKKDKGFWVVIVTYDGPPASIMVPPIYEIETDHESRFVEIRRRMRRDRPSRKQ